MKTFRNDFYKFLNKIKNNESFSLSRWGDGETMILFNEFIDIRNKGNGEFIYDPNNLEHFKYRNNLIDAAKYKSANYFLGLACRCCINKERHLQLKTFVNQDENMLSWANIMVNSNFPLFISEMLPQYNNYNIYLVVNSKGNINNLPFKDKIKKTYYIGTNAWIENYNIIEDLKNDAINTNNSLFLFMAGPFANILVFELNKINPNNTYIDQGSCLDLYLFGQSDRGYLNGSSTLNKVCIW
jgi:hypothetical protein